MAIPAAVAGGLAFPADLDLLAPPLLWSEVLSVLHTAQWRGALSAAEAGRARSAFRRFAVRRDRPAGLYDEAWRMADELGLAKTYDAEFLALARLRECRVLTADAYLHRLGSPEGLTVDPAELTAELS